MCTSFNFLRKAQSQPLPRSYSVMYPPPTQVPLDPGTRDHGVGPGGPWDTANRPEKGGPPKCGLGRFCSVTKRMAGTHLVFKTYTYRAIIGSPPPLVQPMGPKGGWPWESEWGSTPASDGGRFPARARKHIPYLCANSYTPTPPASTKLNQPEAIPDVAHCARDIVHYTSNIVHCASDIIYHAPGISHRGSNHSICFTFCHQDIENVGTNSTKWYFLQTRIFFPPGQWPCHRSWSPHLWVADLNLCSSNCPLYAALVP